MQLVSSRYEFDMRRSMFEMVEMPFLSFFPRGLGDGVGIRTIFHDFRDMLAKPLSDVLYANLFALVLYSIVKQCGDDLFLGTPMLSDNGSNGPQMGNVGYGGAFSALVMMEFHR
jgi:hypothetical protein